ncbi:hypothetical protein FZC84_09760 [Rossellomorea vietnamensis]|uniref:Transporter n=1 Tax=Rossellomorea vietnamensis TaxID=218284 RepID=A0A5D4MCC9_9BACI|nr:hypothetical protein [Rossellomorea vietnamensis]TYR99514.1 hypothetical protein FZC84_09760 [Rossellomorea vietnamensis]
MLVELTALHWLYLVFIGFIILFMIFRKDTTILCIAGIFLIALVANGSLTSSVSSVFTSFIYAITELLSTILVISIIVGMSRTLTKTGINDVMISPFARLIKTPALAYWTIGIVMMLISWFFWPSPAVALLGAVLVPVALRVGLPALGIAMAMNLFGHGIALSGDFVIQAAPKLTSDAAGLPVSEVIQASIPLVIVMGVVTTVTAFFLLKRDMKKGILRVEESQLEETEAEAGPELLSPSAKRFFALMIPALFALNILAMFMFDLQGGDATALIGGTSIFILLIISLAAYRAKGLEQTTSFIIDGFQFGFKVFGPVIPIAAFFYLGDSGFSAIIGEGILPEGSAGIVNDLGGALAAVVPLSKAVGAVTLTTVGAITGLDGSGFSGISLAGSVALLFSDSIGSGAATLTALGQISAIWIGGGTLVPWALIPAAAICNVDPFELARRNLIPVIVGLIATTITAMFLI